MAVVMRLVWPGVGVEEYEEARSRVGWEVEQPTGGLTHIAWFEGDELHVVDVWESAEDFQRFVDGRLMPVVKGELGLEGEPEVTITEAHAHFVPEAVKA